MYIHKKTEKLVWWISVQMEDTYMLIFLLQKRGKIKKQFLLKCLKFSAKFMGSLRFFFSNVLLWTPRSNHAAELGNSV